MSQSSTIATISDSTVSLQPADPPTPTSKSPESPPTQYDPFGYIKAYCNPPSTPSNLEPDNLEDLFEDEVDIAIIDPPYWNYH